MKLNSYFLKSFLFLFLGACTSKINTPTYTIVKKSQLELEQVQSNIDSVKSNYEKIIKAEPKCKSSELEESIKSLSEKALFLEKSLITIEQTYKLEIKDLNSEISLWRTRAIAVLILFICLVFIFIKFMK